MFRRVGAPIALVAGVWILSAALGYGDYVVSQRAMDNVLTGRPAWMLPVLPLGEWPVFLAIFVALRMCAMRGGSSRECVLVGLFPLVPAAVLYAYLFSQFSVSALPALVGSISPVLSGATTAGEAFAVRQYASAFLGLAAICITSTWLYLWVGDANPAPMEGV